MDKYPGLITTEEAGRLLDEWRRSRGKHPPSREGLVGKQRQRWLSNVSKQLRRWVTPADVCTGGRMRLWPEAELRAALAEALGPGNRTRGDGRRGVDGVSAGQGGG